MFLLEAKDKSPNLVSGITFEVGERVEVIDDDPSFALTYLPGTVVEIIDEIVRVRHDTVKDVYGVALVNDVVPSKLRPLAPVVVTTFEHGDPVNIWDGKGWRWGNCLQEHNGLYNVDIRYSTTVPENVVSYKKEFVRIQQEFNCQDGRRFWMYSKIESTEFCLGTRIEIIRHDMGSFNSYYGATIIGFNLNRRVKVKYETIKTHEEQLLTEEITRSDLRPYAPDVMVTLKEGDIVDAWHRSSWRKGVCTDPGDGTSKCTVLFDYVDDVSARIRTFLCNNVRIHQEWWPINTRRFWIYDKR